MKLPKGKKVCIGSKTYIGEIPDGIVERYNLKIDAPKPKPKPEPKAVPKSDK